MISVIGTSSELTNITEWSDTEDKRLIAMAGTQIRKSWVKIAETMSNKTASQCKTRYQRLRPDIKRGKWTTEEDSRLLEAFDLYGNKWAMIAKQFNNRSSKQIRERFINYLDPGISGDKFSLDEDILILTLYRQFGNQWVKIKSYLPGRSADLIKNRYKSSISRNFKFYKVLLCLKKVSEISYNLGLNRNP
jgi:hypothetical protein